MRFYPRYYPLLILYPPVARGEVYNRFTVQHILIESNYFLQFWRPLGCLSLRCICGRYRNRTLSCGPRSASNGDVHHCTLSSFCPPSRIRTYSINDNRFTVCPGSPTPACEDLWYQLESNQCGQIFNLLLYQLSYGTK